MTSSGFVTTITNAFGAWVRIFSAELRTMSALALSRSSRLMPGLRGKPAVPTTTSEPSTAAQPLQPRMAHDALHEPLRQPLAPILRLDVDVPQICVGGEVADHPGQPDLAPAVEDAEAQRVPDRPGHRFPRDSLGPVGPGEK